jgi:hypothetical protein
MSSSFIQRVVAAADVQNSEKWGLAAQGGNEVALT